MAAIREEGQINEHTYLIDAVHNGAQRAFAVYLFKSTDGESCLIDAGTRDSVKVIYERLQQWDAWPLKKLIITHSHWDHSQGVQFLREKAAEQGQSIEVMASEHAMPHLADQSYNLCFNRDQAPFLNIEGVSGLKNNDLIEIGSDVKLRIVDTPGHMVDHISVLDETHHNIFTGDAIGMKWTDGLIVPNPNSDFFDEGAFYQSLDTLNKLDIQGVGLGHFGYLQGDEAQSFLDETRQMYDRWMEIFRENRDKIEDFPFLTRTLMAKLYSHFPKQFQDLFYEGLFEAVALAAASYIGRQ